MTILRISLLLLLTASASALTLAENGATRYQIVLAADATEPEQFAAEELVTYLEQVTGAALPVVAQAVEGSPAIYLGWTSFAKAQGIALAELGEEEWVLRTVGDSLIITGGRPRGTLYGVYEFLEEVVGCHWLDPDTEIVPDRPTLEIDSLGIRAKPQFWQRWLMSGEGVPDAKWRFRIRNHNYNYNFRGRMDFYPQGAFYPQYGAPGIGQNVWLYVDAKTHFGEHPEYYSLVNGERLPARNNRGPGQLCLTNPEVAEIAAESLRRFIREDREAAKTAGHPPPFIYWICQSEQSDTHCQCANCLDVVRREGGESGPMLAFVNAVAAQIEDDFPKVLVAMYAYNLTSGPPKTVRPRENVIVGWCDIYSVSDTIRPLSHPYNRKKYEEFLGWSEIAPRIGIARDFWRAFSFYSHFPTPFSLIEPVADDLRLFANHRAEFYMTLTSDYMEAGQHFVPLKWWLGYLLLVDPHQPVQPLIDTFMTGYYGPAGETMERYRVYLRQRIDAEAQFQMLRDAPFKLAYLDLPFFVEAQSLFADAEARTEAGTPARDHVQEERFILDGALLFLWPWLARELPPGEAMPFEKEAVIQRYISGWDIYTESRYSRFYSEEQNSLNRDGLLRERIVGLFRGAELPTALAKVPREQVADFTWITFPVRRAREPFVPDPAATGGMAAEYASRETVTDVRIGLSNGPERLLTTADLPDDDAYHLHLIGRVDVQPGSKAWAVHERRLYVELDRLYKPEDDNLWDVYISLRRSDSTVRLDRLLLVKAEAGAPLDPVTQAWREQHGRDAAQRKDVPLPVLRTSADGDPARVEWTAIPGTGPWWTPDGNPSDRPISLKLARDNGWLYLQMIDPAAKNVFADPRLFRGDTLEILLAADRSATAYHQIAINPAGEVRTLYHGPHYQEWESGAKVVSSLADDVWQVQVALPLGNLLPRQADPGKGLFINAYRGGESPLLWSPTFGDSFHTVPRFARVTREAP